MNPTSSKGFALLIAVLISSIVLGIGVAMFNVSIKQTLLSSTGRESLVAFSAADGGIECAAYWDYKPVSPFATANPSITCNNTAVTVNSSSCTATTCTHDLTYNLGATAAPCSLLHIVKVISGTLSTTIESRGYNTCDTSDPKRAERAIRITQ